MSDTWQDPEALLCELAMDDPQDLDVHAMAAFLGARVEYRPLQGCEAHLVGYNDRAIITVNSLSIPTRQRFSIGHELGHWVFDRGQASMTCSTRSFQERWNSDHPEARANRYASGLLLPKTMFTQQAQDQPITFQTVKSLASLFNTSLTATAIRLVELSPSLALAYGARRQPNGWRTTWWVKHPQLPDPVDCPGPASLAAQLLADAHPELGPADVPASAWFPVPQGSRLTESSARLDQDWLLTLLWCQEGEKIFSARVGAHPENASRPVAPPAPAPHACHGRQTYTIIGGVHPAPLGSRKEF